MRATAVILGLVFSLLLIVVDWNSSGAGVLIGFVGLVASIATMIHPRAGLVLFVAAVVVALVAAPSDIGHLVYAAMFAVPALLAWRSARRNKIQAERASRMDRYVRQQLGE